MQLRILVFLLVFSSGETAVALVSPDSARQKIAAFRIESEIELTGKLSDPRWNLAQPVQLAFEVTPGENTPASQKTTLRILYSAEYVYFGIDCKDTNPSAIRAHITDRDKIFDDDYAGVILDTYGDYQRAYEFMVNPYGIQADLMRVGGDEDESFDTVWKSASDISDSGWSAILAIPFKSLRFPSVQEQNWVAIFFRNFPRTSREQISWTRYDRNNPCFLCQGGMIVGITDVQSTNSVELLPYVAGQQRGALRDESDPSTPFENGKLNGRVGGGIRYSPSPDLSVEAVVNPDFSQVESDATQISVNSTFALNYPEKRPFFLYGADLFQNNTGTLYSRTINNPLGAARVIGKSGSFSFGYLAASDRNTPYIVPGEENSDFIATDNESFSNVARVRYDFGNETFVGGMMSARNTSTAHNYVGGIDWSYRFWENYAFSGELSYSDTKEVNDLSLLSSMRMFGSTGHDAAFNGEQYGGVAYLLSIRRDARDYSVALQYMDRAPTFQAQSGFVPNNNTRIAFLQQEIFLRVIGQYDQFDEAIDFYPLLSCKLNPFTIFYAGSTYDLSDFGSPFGIRQTSRQYFLKFQYLLRS